MPVQTTKDQTLPATALPTGTWEVDPVHSSVGFEIKSMGIVSIKGYFDDFEGTVVLPGEIDGAVAKGTVSVASIHTRSPARDEHLRSADHFDAEAHPEIRFESQSIEYLGERSYRVAGRLEIRGIGREVELEAELEGTAPDPWGNERIGLRVTGEIDRREYGLVANETLGNGALLIGNQVKLVLDLGAVKS